MNFNDMNFDTFFKLAAVGGEPIHAIVSRVIGNAMFHELDTSMFETPDFYEFYGKAMLAEKPSVDTQALYAFFGKALLKDFPTVEADFKAIVRAWRPDLTD